MQFRKVLLATATLVTLSPAIVLASPPTDALNACAHAFADSISTEGASSPTFKLNYSQAQFSPVSDYYTREFTFFLKAANPKTGVVVASATCKADASGTVTALKQANPKAVQTTLASR